MSLARLYCSLLQNCYDNGTMRSGKRTFSIQDGDDFGNIDLHVNAAKGAHYTRNMEGGRGIPVVRGDQHTVLPTSTCRYDRASVHWNAIEIQPHSSYGTDGNSEGIVACTNALFCTPCVHAYQRGIGHP